MANARRSNLSKARNIEEMAEFWDTHSLADYENEIKEVEMSSDPSARRTMIGVESELLDELREIAKERKISTQTSITLDDEVLQEVKVLTQSSGTTLSAFTQYALQLALQRQHIKELEAKHRQGYLQQPVKEGEFSGWEDEQTWGTL